MRYSARIYYIIIITIITIVIIIIIIIIIIINNVLINEKSDEAYKGFHLCDLKQREANKGFHLCDLKQREARWLTLDIRHVNYFPGDVFVHRDRYYKSENYQAHHNGV